MKLIFISILQLTSPQHTCTMMVSGNMEKCVNYHLTSLKACFTAPFAVSIIFTQARMCASHRSSELAGSARNANGVKTAGLQTTRNAMSSVMFVMGPSIITAFGRKWLQYPRMDGSAR